MIPRSLDLNLLRVFDFLMRERSVSGAATQLNLTQPSASNALERLRQALGDPLMTRQGNKMVPTQAALDLWPHVQAALASLSAGLEDLRAFQPATACGVFKIGLDAYSMAVAGSTIAASIRAAAPNMSIEFRPASAKSNSDDLVRGHLDLIIGPVWHDLPGLDHVLLKHETFICMLRPSLKVSERAGVISLEDYTRLPHLLYSQVGIVEGNVDIGLAAIGKKRSVALSTPFDSAIAPLLTSEDIITTLGRSLGERIANTHGLKVLDLPTPVPGFDLTLAWAPGNTPSKRHMWLRENIKASFKGGFASLRS